LKTAFFRTLVRRLNLNELYSEGLILGCLTPFEEQTLHEPEAIDPAVAPSLKLVSEVEVLFCYASDNIQRQIWQPIRGAKLIASDVFSYYGSLSGTIPAILSSCLT
jgi:hypothetical protein